MAFIEVESLVKSYPTPAGPLVVLHDLSLAVEAGEMVAIIGASGVGKSTLLHVLGGLDAFDAGRVRIGDADVGRMNDEARVRFRNRHVGFVFQFHHLLPEFNALENVEMPLRIADRPAASRDADARAVIERVGLAPRALHRPGALSALDASSMAGSRAIGATGVFSPVVDGRALTFEPVAEGFRDRETGSLWTVLGHAREGPLAGKRLRPIAHVDAFWFAWAAFHPSTSIHSAP